MADTYLLISLRVLFFAPRAKFKIRLRDATHRWLFIADLTRGHASSLID